MRFARFIAIALVLTLGVAGAVDARQRIKPKAGNYTGSVTNSNGTGPVHLFYATLLVPPSQKPRKAVSLDDWTGTLKCEDGTTTAGNVPVVAPLKGVKFSGRSKSGNQTVTLSGRFTSSTALQGTARIKTTGDAPQDNCDTGPVKFKAKRGSG